MNLATLRSRVEQILGLEGLVGSTDLDAALNWVWQFEIPDRVGGACAEGYVEFPTADGTEEYDIDTAATNDGAKLLKNLLVPIWDKTTPQLLDYTEQPRTFWQWFDISSATKNRPTGALLQNRTLTLRPIPDGVYTIRFTAQLYRAALTSDGITDEAEALAVVGGAAQNLAVLLGRDKSLARATALHEKEMPLVEAKYKGRSHGGLTQADVMGEDF